MLFTGVINYVFFAFIWLTATHHSYGSLAWLYDFFLAHPWRSDPSTDLHAKWLKRRGFTQG